MKKRQKLLGVFIILIITVFLIVGCDKKAVDNTKYDDVMLFATKDLLTTDSENVTNVKIDSKGNYYVSFIENITEDTMMEVNHEKIKKYDSNFNFIGEVKGDLMELVQTNVFIGAFDINKDNIYVCYTPTLENVKEREIIKFDLDGNEIGRTPIDVNEQIWDGHILSKIYVWDSYIVLVSGVGIQICDENGKTIKEIYNDLGNPYSIDATAVDKTGNLYYSTSENGTPSFYKVDCKTGDNVYKKSFSFGNSIRNIVVNGNEVLIQKEIQLLKIDIEKDTEKVICEDIRDYDTVNDKNIIDSFFIRINIMLGENGEIMYSITNDRGFSKIVALTELVGEDREKEIARLNEVKKNKKVINLFIPYKDNILTDILYDFEKENDISINTEYYSDSFMNFNIEDYRQIVSTRLLSGNPGWDIMSTEILPFMQYAKQGIFENLYDIEGGEVLKNSQRFYTNIFEACEYNKGLYFMPTYINYYAISSDTEINAVNTMEDIYNMCLENGKGTFKLVKTNFIRVLLQECLKITYDKVEYDKGKFAKNIEILKKIQDEGFCSEDGSGKNTLFRTDYVMIDNEYRQFTEVLTSSDKKPFNMSIGYGIYKNSEVKKEALELLVYLVENYEFRYGVSKEKVQELLDDAYEQSKSFTTDEAVHSKALELKNTKEKLYNSLNYLVEYDYKLYDVLYDEINRFLNGEISLETVVDRFEQSVNIFIKENE